MMLATTELARTIAGAGLAQFLFFWTGAYLLAKDTKDRSSDAAIRLGLASVFGLAIAVGGLAFA